MGDSLLSAQRITAMGRGEDLPIETNATREGRSKNRRVEIIVLDQGHTEEAIPIIQNRSARDETVAPLHRCDELAGSPSDQNRLGPSVSWDSLDADSAVSACIEAVKMYPGVGRFEFQLARAYDNNSQMLEASRWYRKAAENGHASAQNELGQMYEIGTIVSKDYKEAIKWYRKAAAQNNEEAKMALKRLGVGN